MLTRAKCLSAQSNLNYIVAECKHNSIIHHERNKNRFSLTSSKNKRARGCHHGCMTKLQGVTNLIFTDRNKLSLNEELWMQVFHSNLHIMNERARLDSVHNSTLISMDVVCTTMENRRRRLVAREQGLIVYHRTRVTLLLVKVRLKLVYNKIIQICRNNSSG